MCPDCMSMQVFYRHIIRDILVHFSPLRPTYLCDADLEIWRSETVTRCPLNSRESGWAMCMQYVWHGVNVGSTFDCIKGSIAENCNVGTLLHQCYLNHSYIPLIEECWRSRGGGR